MSWKKPSFALLSFAAVLVVLCSTCLIPPVRADNSNHSWDRDFSYRKHHMILGSTAGALTDYPVQIIVYRTTGTDSGNIVYVGSDCKTDFGDIRFTAADGVTPLSYWIEEMMTGNYAIFWVEILLIPADPGFTYIYMDYDDPSASTTSNIDATFDVACDMEEGDLSDWDTSSGTATKTASTDYSHTGTYGLKMVPAPGTPAGSRQTLTLSGDTRNQSYRSWFYDTGCSALDWSTALRVRDNSVGDNVLSCGNNGGPLGYYWYWDVGGAGYQSTGVSRTTGWHYFEFRASSSGIDYVVDGVNVYTSTSLDPSSLDAFQTACYRENPNPSYFDDAIIRKWVDPEPSHGLWGGEELDSTNPNWAEIPSDQVVEFGTPFSYDVNASDASGIASYWISDTDNFTIDSSGAITNAKSLAVGTYILEVRAYDPYGNYCTASFQVTVNLPITLVIPGFPLETIILGAFAALGYGVITRRNRRKQ